MKHIRPLIGGLAACITLAMVTSLHAQTATEGTAKVVRVNGHARYTTGNNVWQPLKVGAVLKPGTVIQTAAQSYVDLVLAEGGAGAAGMAGAATPLRGEGMLHQPRAEQNVVRVWEDSVLGIDRLSIMRTGTDVVTDTQLDLRSGRIFGTVKKMSNASKYEVKIPNGIAGIRGTIYMLSADGVLTVLEGSVVIAYVGPDGTAVTQVITGGQEFDARTGQLITIPDQRIRELRNMLSQTRVGLAAPATVFAVDRTIYTVSPIVEGD
jgi:hypothetical protein